MFNKSKLFIAGATLVASATVFSSCQKEQVTTGNNPYVKPAKEFTLTETQARRVETMAASIPVVRLYDEAHNRYMDMNIFERSNRDWSFANPYEGATYAESGTWISADGTEMVVINISGTSSGAGGGGTVVAGNSALSIDYAFCFNIDIEATGGDLFDFGGEFGGSVAGVIGIAGDFEALANDELGEDPDFEDFFQGFAEYIIYDDYANGSYEVLNWFDDLESDLDDLEDHAFSFVIDFSTPGIYFSQSGTISASGSSMDFNGTYLALEDFLLDFDEEGEDEPSVSEVAGFGEMGCDM
jgi:hypothetical protein